MRFVTICLCLTSSMLLGETWSGLLVDAKCYAIARSNVNVNDATTVDRDVQADVESCRPNAKTKSFALVQQDSSGLNLDSVGNAKAADPVRNRRKEKSIKVTVTGERAGKAIRTDTISAEK